MKRLRKLQKKEKEIPEQEPETEEVKKLRKAAALKLLDASFTDLGYARYLLQSNLSTEKIIRDQVNWKDPVTGVGLLHCFAYSDLFNAIKLLLAHNADVNIQDKNGETPLHWCAKMNSVKSAKVLTEDKSSKIDLPDNSGSTVFHYATALQNMEMIVFLLDYGANVLLKDKEGLTAIELLLPENQHVAAALSTQETSSPTQEQKPENDPATNEKQPISDFSKSIFLIYQRHYNKKDIPLPESLLAYAKKLQFTDHFADNIGYINIPVKLKDVPPVFADPDSRDYLLIETQAPIQNKHSMQSHSRTIAINNIPFASALKKNGVNMNSPGGGGTPGKKKRGGAHGSFTVSFGEDPTTTTTSIQPFTVYDQVKAQQQQHPFPSSSSSAINRTDSTDRLATDTTTPRRDDEDPSSAAIRSAMISRTKTSPLRGSILRSSGQFSTVPEEDSRGGSPSSPVGSSSSPKNKKKKEKPLFFIRGLQSPSGSMDKNDIDQPTFDAEDDFQRRKNAMKNRSMTKSLPAITILSTKSMDEILQENERSTNPNTEEKSNNKAPSSPKRSATSPRKTNTSSLPVTVEGEDSDYVDSKRSGGGSQHSYKQGEDSLELDPPTSSSNHLPPTASSNRLLSKTNSQNSAANVLSLPNLGNNSNQVNFVELAYPPTDILPFLPTPTAQTDEELDEEDTLKILQRAHPDLPWKRLTRYNVEHADVIICVEHCCDCHLHNDQSLRHNVSKYVQTANAVIFSLIRAMINAKLAIRLYAMRAKPMNIQRLGAFEVTIALRMNLPDLALDIPIITQPPPKKENSNSARKEFDLFGAEGGSNVMSPPPSGGRQTMIGGLGGGIRGIPQVEKKEPEPIITYQRQKGQVKWVTHRLFSKLETKSWPNIKTLEQKAVHFVELAMKDVLYSRFRVHPSAPLTIQPTNNNGTANNLNPLLSPAHGLNPNPSFRPVNTPPEDLEEYEYDIYSDFKYFEMPIDVALDIQDQYKNWIEHMKLPPQIVKDPLDMEFPTEIIYHPRLQPQLLLDDQGKSTTVSQLKHPQGPYIDINLFNQVSQKEIFEGLVLEHFHVFDARFQRWKEEGKRSRDAADDGEEVVEPFHL